MALVLCDVGPRDGLQNEPETLEPAVRADLVNRLASAGLPRVEAVSFVRPDRVPQMAGAEEVVAGIRRRDGTEYSGLVLNDQGYERFEAAGLDRVNATLGATEEFNRRNANASLAEAIERVERIVAAADKPATVTISVAFGCPFEGHVDPARVSELAARFDGSEVVLADTIGKPYWGQGYATEAAGAARDFAIEQLAARRLIALIIHGNDASENVARKLGFEHERDIRFGRREAGLYSLNAPAR